MKKIILLFTSILFLQGCVGVFVTGAAVGAAATAVIYDKRSFITIRDDQTIGYQIENKIYAEGSETRKSAISAISYHYTVLLVGQAPNNAIRRQAIMIARKTPKVKRVISQTTIEPNLPAIKRAEDTWITTKVKTKMLATPGLSSGEIKVVTNNRVVYLMGIVSKEQGHLAAEAARKVNGVAKVVKVFEYKRAS